MIKIGLIFYIFVLLGCTDSQDEVDTSVSSRYLEFPRLPTSSSESIEITGAMTWWFWEGAGGCFGTLTDGRKNIELHAEAALCEPIEYEEGASASVQITYDSNKQYVSGKKCIQLQSLLNSIFNGNDIRLFNSGSWKECIGKN